MAIYLGIDGGGTGCRAAVADAEGVVIGRGAAGPANVFSDPGGARANVLAAARVALSEAGLAGEERRVVAVLGLAGAQISGVAAPFAAAMPFGRTEVVNDAVIAVRGALGAEDGVAAVLGTGSVFAAQRGGALRFIGGWGFLLGDHAGGARMGRALLEAALLAQDGLADWTPLLAEVVAGAGGPDGLVVFARTATPADFARYARRIVSAADPAAEAVLAEAEQAVAAALDALLGDAPAPVCFLGGLGPVFAARLASRYGGLIRPARGASLDGALALARKLEEETRTPP